MKKRWSGGYRVLGSDSRVVRGSYGLIVGWLLFLTVNCYGQQLPKYGVGIMVGGPNELNFKYWKSETIGHTAGISWGDYFNFHLDYLVHNYKVFKTDELTGKTPVFYGLGLRMHKAGGKNTESDFGLRGILGAEYIFKEIPFEIFFEFAPVFLVSPEMKLDMDAGIGVRYCFK